MILIEINNISYNESVPRIMKLHISTSIKCIKKSAKIYQKSMYCFRIHNSIYKVVENSRTQINYSKTITQHLTTLII